MTIKRSAVGWQGLGVLHSIVEAGELIQEDPVEKREGQLHRTVGGKDDGDFVLHKRLNATATGSDSGVCPRASGSDVLAGGCVMAVHCWCHAASLWTEEPVAGNSHGRI